MPGQGPTTEVSSGADTPAAVADAYEPVLKRRRVAQACQTCRAQKTKCDGRKPECNRCRGYGHTCIWTPDKKSQASELESLSRRSPSSGVLDEIQSSSTPLRKAVQMYSKVINSMRPKLSFTDRTTVDMTLSYIRGQLPDDINKLINLSPLAASSEGSESSDQNDRTDKPKDRHRFLGQASDVRFFHAIKEILQDENVAENQPDGVVQSYELEAPIVNGIDNGDKIPDLPSRELADSYVDIYFFTIHIAYPFINKLEFMARYTEFWDNLPTVKEDASWLSLLYTLFAIGAYYSSFPRTEHPKVQAHFDYFNHALSLAGPIMMECTLGNIQMLLAECFFLLATGQTDRCWNTLGLAIRVGQSIGLHVEDSLRRPSTNLAFEEEETMRRTWYSLYVLDRLVALQLGRPVAIHEAEYQVNLPSKSSTSVFGREEDIFAGTKDRPSLLDYFHCVIKFSRILGQVISDLYSPSQVEIDPDDMLMRTAALDRKLSEWKLNLPRHLRFDLGHTFEQSVVFRRQRNMLAIKFHHLRALIHRPYLCLVWLQRHNRSLMTLLHRAHDRVEKFEKICVLEAQQTAHLLHNVATEKNLVYDFPWWQMISCLLCASSILLVASACIEGAEVTSELQSQALKEDAETCLKVFDALSSNSDAARRARDMMKGLKKTRIVTKFDLPPLEQVTLDRSLDQNRGPVPTTVDFTNTILNQSLSYDTGSESMIWHTWPGELSDAMAWSAQFLAPAQDLNFEDPTIGPSDISHYTNDERTR